MLATLQALGIMPSFSRPAVSNYNPYSESIFKTLKYRPEYPAQPFANLIETRQPRLLPAGAKVAGWVLHTLG